jgi:hypothetical protein
MGVNAFVLGLASDLTQRVQRLLNLIAEHPFHPDVAQFRENVLDCLRQAENDLHALLDSDLLVHPSLWPYAMSDYQDLFQDVALVEAFALPILLRYGDYDHQCYQLLLGLVSEIGYPTDLTPVVTATSDQYYYWAQPELRIVGVPAGDLGGILGWPDLVHELSHVLLNAYPGFLSQFSPAAAQYFQQERNLRADIGGLGQDSKWLSVAQIKWGEKQEGTWRVELAADLIAAYLVGPAYGWQHVRLAMSHGSDPYWPSPGQLADHPADQARLDAILAMLALLNLKEEADEIENHWLETLELEHHDSFPQGYDLYYPQSLLTALAQVVFTECRARGLVSFADQPEEGNPGVIHMINQAWHKFNEDPTAYVTWESEAISLLKARLTTAPTH